MIAAFIGFYNYNEASKNPAPPKNKNIVAELTREPTVFPMDGKPRVVAITDCLK